LLLGEIMPYHGYAGNNQDAILWRRVGTHSSGAPVVSLIAEQVECVWTDTGSEDAAPDSESISIDATVSGLDTDIPVGSAMAKGRVEDLAGTAQLPTENVFRVVRFANQPDWRGRDFDKEASLTRAGDALKYQA
jgi:hypothetical protein